MDLLKVASTEQSVSKNRNNYGLQFQLKSNGYQFKEDVAVFKLEKVPEFSIIFVLSDHWMTILTKD